MKEAKIASSGVSWNNSIFMRISVTFIAILLPLYILGIFIYNAAQQSVRTEISSSMISQISFYMDNLDKEMQRVRSLEYDMINDTNLNRLSSIPASMNNIEKVQAMLNLQNRMEAIKSKQHVHQRNYRLYPVHPTYTDRQGC